jgi:hypothetical protein
MGKFSRYYCGDMVSFYDGPIVKDGMIQHVRYDSESVAFYYTIKLSKESLYIEQAWNIAEHNITRIKSRLP